MDNFNVWMINEVAEDYNVVLVSPHFDTMNFTKYHRLNVGYGERADWRLIEIAENFTSWLNLTSNKFYIFGFSGGGQFTHRFVMAHPEYIERAIAGAAGVYTFPNASIPYSHGLNLSEYEPIDLDFDLELAYQEYMCIMIGLNDTERGDDLSKSEASDAQGLNRLERARNFYNATSENATENGWTYNYSLQEVPDCEHSYGPMKSYIIDYLFVQ
jgi:pimeloyl-ACP methyl ester carboxylesterase